MLDGGNIGLLTPIELQKGNNRTSLLFEKVNFRTRYHEDGRVLINSEMIDHMTTSELWENLIVRKFAQKMKMPTLQEQQQMVRRLSSMYKDKKRLSRVLIQSIAEEDEPKPVVVKPLVNGKVIVAARNSANSKDGVRWRRSPAFPVISIGKNGSTARVTSVEAQMKNNGVISLEIDDDLAEEECYEEEEAHFVTLINVNDAFLREVLVEEHQRLDQEEHQRSQATTQRDKR